MNREELFRYITEALDRIKPKSKVHMRVLLAAEAIELSAALYALFLDTYGEITRTALLEGLLATQKIASLDERARGIIHRLGGKPSIKEFYTSFMELLDRASPRRNKMTPWRQLIDTEVETLTTLLYEAWSQMSLTSHQELYAVLVALRNRAFRCEQDRADAILRLLGKT